MIERAILAHMSRALESGDTEQIRRGLALHKKYTQSVDKGLVDYPEEVLAVEPDTTLPVAPVVEERDWYQSFDLVRSAGLGARARIIVARMYYRGEISTLDELRSLPDKELLAIHQVGPVTLGRLREVFPYSPPTNGS